MNSNVPAGVLIGGKNAIYRRASRAYVTWETPRSSASVNPARESHSGIRPGTIRWSSGGPLVRVGVVLDDEKQRRSRNRSGDLLEAALGGGDVVEETAREGRRRLREAPG